MSFADFVWKAEICRTLNEKVRFWKVGWKEKKEFF